MESLNIAILYDPDSNFTNAVYDYLNAFKLYSCHNITYIPVRYYIFHKLNLMPFDAVIIFYSIASQIELFHNKHPMLKSLIEYNGKKIVIIQDEYDHIIKAPQIFSKIGITDIVTNIPSDYQRLIYTEQLLPNVNFIHALTGYVSESLLNLSVNIKSADQRKILIGYRGRPLHYKYGHLGFEKINIGVRMREICRQKSLPIDIEWTEEKRIYGEDWPKFLSECRVMLGTESGSEVFDLKGDLRERIDCYVNDHPHASYSEIHEIFLKGIDGKVPMAQVSPKLFECICLRTGLVLFEGNYSGILVPKKHYIPLKKDFSNVEEVLALVNNCEYIDKMTESAYIDIILSEKFTYKSFIKMLFSKIESELPKKPRAELFFGLIDVRYRNDIKHSKIYLIKNKIKRILQIDNIYRIPSTNILRRKIKAVQNSFELVKLLKKIKLFAIIIKKLKKKPYIYSFLKRILELFQK